jgi:hypothetical protein
MDLYRHHRFSITLIIVTVITSVLFWNIFYLKITPLLGFPKSTLETVFANYDGPNYMAISKCGYLKNCLGSSFSLPLPNEYYPAHLPGYPLIIKFFDLFTTGPKAMLLATLLGSVFLSVASFKFFRLFLKPKKAFWLALVLLFLPARLFVIRQIGAPESWFLGSILASVFFFKKKNYLVSALFAASAQLFKSPGILLFGAYFLLAGYELFFKKRNLKNLIKKYIFYLFVPVAILGIFYLYYLQTGDFWAYFNSGDNFHLTLLPYQIFISTRSWINTIWLEDVIYILVIAYLGLYFLFKKRKINIVTIFPAVYLLATIFVAHRDISRYIAPVYPFLFLAFQKVLTKKYFKIIFLIILPAVFLYGINFVIGNTAPIADWTPYL